MLAPVLACVQISTELVCGEGPPSGEKVKGAEKGDCTMMREPDSVGI